MSRSLRRHHRERILNKMERDDYYALSTSVGRKMIGGVYTAEDRLRNYKKSYQHRQACSCFQCGNPRKQKFSRKDKLTIQERKAREQSDSF